MCCTQLAENTGRKKSPFWHHRTSLSRCVFAAKVIIDNRKKNLLNTDTSPYVLIIWTWPTNGWDLLASLEHPCKFQRVSRLGSVTARHSSSRRQPNFAALNRGRHLYSTGRPSRWALAHIFSYFRFCYLVRNFCLTLSTSHRNLCEIALCQFILPRHRVVEIKKNIPC